MRRALLLAVVLVLAGCQAPTVPGADGGPEAPGSTGGSTLPDPPADRLGWENGYWHNDSIGVTRGDGLNATEREAVVARAMARVEYVRDREFEATVPVDVINRSAYRANQSGDRDPALARFDNAKFQALFLIGEREDSIEVQDETRGASVLGYYSTSREAIVLVAEGEAPTLSGESVLAHELVHALQDQHFDLEGTERGTRDAYQGRNGIVEGDASYVQRQYMDRCGEAWSCLEDAGTGSEDDSDDGGDVHPGISILEYFPYSDGAGFVAAVREGGGWDAVEDVYGDVPDGATEVIHHERHYPEWEPAEVTLADETGPDWERIRPPDRPDYGVMGQSAIVAAQAYTIVDDSNDTAVVSPREVVNVRSSGSLDETDPYRYDTPAATGWAGGRFQAYRRDDGELAYVWRTRWESDAEAAEFAAAWERVIDHWGGQRAAGSVWVIDDGEFADAYAVRTDGNTVTVVNAPERGELSAIHDR